jgi:hypothetical protein
MVVKRGAIRYALNVWDGLLKKLGTMIMNDEHKITDWNEGLIEWAGGGLDDIATNLLVTWRDYLNAEIEERTGGSE